MFKYIRHTLSILLVLPFLAGCAENLYPDRQPDSNGEELPIEFDFRMPTTRGTDGIDENKKSFAEGDVIHVLGTFNTKELQEDGSRKEGSTKRYGAYEYKNRQWVAQEPKLGWPSVAVNGTFEAYYIGQSNGVLTDLTEIQPVLLSDLTKEKDKPHCDPLKAKSDQVDYGHAVKMDFEHLCAYLTLIDLEPQVASAYWFYRKDGELLNNAFKFGMEWDADKKPKAFIFDFCAVSNENEYDGLVYIASDVDTDFTNGKAVTQANYFLEPGRYETFLLCYPAEADKTYYNYLEYDYNRIPPQAGGTETENHEPQLEAGTAYRLTVTKSPGITINSPSSGEDWHDGPPYFDVDVEAFLHAIYNKTDYTYNETKILEATADGVKLLQNVDFNKKDYAEFDDTAFLPNVMEGTVFDGDYHYIQNLAWPLFRYNYGTIKNLGIHDIDISATSCEYKFEDDGNNVDKSRHGALCMWNRSHATINNVRVANVTLNVTVQSKIKDGDDSSETHNIGGIVGSNTGNISEAALSGPFVIKVDGDDTNASVLIGGIAGQNAAEGTISGVKPLESDLSFLITNECQSQFGSYSIGGVVGESSGFIEGVILSDVIIDGTKSTGVTSYIGGIAGQLAVSTSSSASLASCIVEGSVTAGITAPYKALTSGSYIGGIAGADLDVSVLGCRTLVSVHGPGSELLREGVIYATGGAFGRIRSATTLIENIIAYGSALDGPDDAAKKQYVGSFSGIVPKGLTWENYANNNISIRPFPGYEPVGGALDSNNNE